VNLEDLGCSQCDIKDFKGIENLQKLKVAYMTYCRSLNDITGISKLSNLQYLNFDRCPNLTNIDEVSKIKTLLKLGLENIKKCNLDFIYNMKSLRYLMLDNCRDFPSLQFINEMPNLICLSISDTNILDGDLTPCKRLKFAFTLDKRHYNLKSKDLPRDHKYGFYRPMELE
jgi:Leucine-rich repeat (LRR) protein